MSISAKIRRGNGPFWSAAKRLAKVALAFHLPVNAMTLPFWKSMYCLHVGIREGCIWGRRFLWNEPLFRSQCRSVGSGLELQELPYIEGQGSIILGDQVRLSGQSSFVFNNRHYDAPLLQIGHGTFVGHQCSFRVAKGLTIGKDCLIASRVMISDYDGHPLDAKARREGQTSALADIHPVALGNDVWIGTGACILKGVQIGDRAIIAAHTVVTRNVPGDCVVAGNPGRIVKTLDHPETEEAECRANRVLVSNVK